jgi:predicted transposase YdaD
MFERVTMEAAKSTEFARMLWEGERRQAVEQGRQEGLEQGLEKGRDQEREQGRQRILRVIRRTLSRKFPDLADHPALELVPLDRLEDLHDSVLAADNVATAVAAILDSSRPA